MNVYWQVNGMWVDGRIGNSEEAGEKGRCSGGNLLCPGQVTAMEVHWGLSTAFRTWRWVSMQTCEGGLGGLQFICIRIQAYFHL